MPEACSQGRSIGTDTVVCDVDGTLVDTNYQHALAWYRAFRRYGVTLPVWRIHQAIGMGGDQLVGSVAGDDVEAEHGDDIRAAWEQEYERMIEEVAPLPDARELLVEIDRAGLHLVLASSGKPHHVERYLDLLDARKLAQAWTSSEDVEHTKPAPDLVEVALGKVGAQRAVVVGDSVWDCEAARRLGVPSVAVRTGGFAADELTDAGAHAVYESLDALREALPALPFGQPR